MLRYMLGRIAAAIPTLLVVFTLVFFVVRVLPGDPATAALGDNANEEAVLALQERMGLNRPLSEQYFSFLGDVIQGDLGNSLITGKSINEQVAEALPFTLDLTISSVFVGVLLGVPIGVVTALRRNTWVDYSGRVFSLLGLSVPAFYFGVLLIWLVSYKLGWLPAVGGGDRSDLGDRISHLILPALTLGLIMTATVARLTRSAMLNVLKEDFMRTARAKGLGSSTVNLQHGLRGALVPVVSIVGIWTAGLIADSVLTETVFARPGLGKMLVGAIRQRDFNTLQSVMLVYTAFVLVVNLITDLIYSVVDPRIRS